MLIDRMQTKEYLRKGLVVAIPTETVYGLGALLSQPKAVKQIFSLKKRPRKNPLIVHVSNLNQVKNLTIDLCDEALTLAKAFWPGPLTLILQADITKVPSFVRAGLPTVAIRMPGHPELLSLIEEIGPIVAPSANLSGRPSSTKSCHVEEDFGFDFPIWGAPSPSIGIESTIIGKVPDWRLLRLGSIAASEIESVLGENLSYSDATICPGKMFKHYSPKAALIIDSNIPGNIDAIVGYANKTYPSHIPFFSLGSLENPQEIASNLYGVLRTLDQRQIKRAWIDLELPPSGFYETIKERLLRAAQEEPV